MLGYARAVAGIHPWLGGAAIVVCACAAFVGGFLYWRGRGAGTITTHLLSLGPLTWPHLLVRALLAEQLFRAQCIRANHPYHRGWRPD